MRDVTFFTRSVAKLSELADDQELNAIGDLLRQAHGAMCLYLWEKEEGRLGPTGTGPDPELILELINGCQQGVISAVSQMMGGQRESRASMLAYDGDDGTGDGWFWDEPTEGQECRPSEGPPPAKAVPASGELGLPGRPEQAVGTQVTCHGMIAQERLQPQLDLTGQGAQE